MRFLGLSREGGECNDACVSSGEGLMGGDCRYCGAGDTGGATAGPAVAVPPQTEGQTE